MAKRKKRLEKGIASLEKQIILHEEKKQRTLNEKKFELADYYDKEIAQKEKDKAKKQHQRDKL